jgi:transcriptional regulator with XRE-family HTH domain
LLGERIAKLRKELKLSQYELADRLGYSRGKLSNYEQGSRQPDYDTLQKLADFFGVTTDYLLGRTNDKKGFVNEKDNYNPLTEINKMVKEYGIEQFGFFDIEKWKHFTPEDVEDLRKHFEWVAHKAKERNEEKK